MNQPVQRVAGILLAAGASTRMGKTKQLLPLGGKTLVERVLMEALASQLERIVLVCFGRPAYECYLRILEKSR